jgi:hypothetical protein
MTAAAHESPEARTAELYRLAAAARRTHRGSMAMMVGRRTITDAALVTYVTNVLRSRPGARCTQEREVAVWLNRMVVAEDRWFRTWQRTVSAIAQAEARAKLPPGPIPVVWLP